MWCVHNQIVLMMSWSDIEPAVREAIKADDKIEFLQLVRFNFLRSSRKKKEIYWPEIMSYIINYKAVKCAKALLEGESGHNNVDFNAVICKLTGLPPLHESALKNFHVMVDLFLSLGASANIRCTTDDHHYSKMLPINLSLYSIAENYSVKQWATGPSVFKLIVRLCLEDMSQPLQCVKLLASKTEDILDEIYHYVLEGKVIELAALLLADHKKVLSPFSLQRICSSDAASGSITFRQLVTTESAFLSTMGIRLKHSDKYQIRQACKEKLLVRMRMLQLFEIFEYAGDPLAAYLKLDRDQHTPEKVSEEVVWILKEAGFTLKDEDLDTSVIEGDYVLMENLCFPEEKHVNSDGESDEEIDAAYLAKKELVTSRCMEEGIIDPISYLKPGIRESTSCNEKSINARPYEQWRFTSTNGLRGSYSFIAQNSEAFPFLEDFSTVCVENNHVFCLRQAVEKLCRHEYLKDWSCKMSIFKLLYILYHPKMRKELELVRMHAIGINSAEKFGLLGCYYVKEGKLIELAALMMVAHKKLIPQMKSQRAGESMKIHQCLLSEFKLLIDEDVSSMRYSSSRKSVEDRRMVLTSALLLLETFERAGHWLDYNFPLGRYDVSYRDRGLAKNIAHLLKKSGFVTGHTDISVQDLSCFSGKDNPTRRPSRLESLKIFLSKEAGNGMSIDTQPTNSSPFKQIRQQQQNPGISFPHSCNLVKAFHTFRMCEQNSSVMFPSSPLATRAKRADIKGHLPSPKLSPEGKWILTIVKQARHLH